MADDGQVPGGKGRETLRKLPPARGVDPLQEPPVARDIRDTLQSKGAA